MWGKLALKGGEPVRSRPFSPWPIRGETERTLLLEVFDSGTWSFGGPKENEFANRFAAFTGAQAAFCVSNGSVGLEIALRALGIGPGDEVIVPAVTWHATAWAAVQVGATPVFADICEADWCIDPADVLAKITPRTRAIIPVHLYDQMAEMDEILALANRHNLRVVEDCAHAHGARWGDRGAGALGDIGSFSFQQSKSMTAGEGGILVTSNEELAHRIYGLKNSGRPWKDGRFGFGGNYRITEFQAAILLGQLERFEEELARKTENAALFREKIAAVPGVQPTALKSRVTRRGMYGVSVRVDPKAFGGIPRDILVSALNAEGLPVQAPYAVVYRSSLWTAGAKLVNFGPGADPAQRLGLNADCPVSERVAAREGVVIPHHVFLGPEEDIDDLVAGFGKVQASASDLKRDALEKKARGMARSLLKITGIST